MILVGDIGGTKTILAIYEFVNNKWICHAKRSYVSKHYENFNDIIKIFLNTVQIKISVASFGIAGPITDGCCCTTNLPWKISAKSLMNDFEYKEVFLLNDLEAFSYGLDTINQESLVSLNNGIRRNGNRAVIAAGTGLGESIIYFDGKNFTPIQSEGGHVDFAPRNKKEMELLSFLQEIYPHVSYERILSGDGIAKLYEFALKSGMAFSSDVQNEIFQAKENLNRNSVNEYLSVDIAPIITNAAISGKCPTSIHLLDLFVDIYGAEAGNLALKSFALGGVYIGGGIAPKIINKLLDGKFLAAFIEKGRFKSFMSEIPVNVVLDQDTPLKGAALYAKKHAKA